MVKTHRAAAYLRLAGLSEQNIGKIVDDYYASFRVLAYENGTFATCNHDLYPPIG
jgi:hypothetical protein